MDLAIVDAIIDRHEARPTSLLAILQDVQDEQNWLPREAVDHICRRLDVPLSRVYAMATFFDAFHLQPRGRHVCTVCMGTACHVRGARRLLEQLERDLSIPSGGTTDDMQFSIEEINCVGACALGPLILVDGEYHGNMTSDRVSRMIRKIKRTSQTSKPSGSGG